ncbi:DUF1289 domain-containing protein [Shewanella intestini]|uniref:DUF1289 domain-containing protein n=1 Tax=Shewanella intestini TaxID=2017544 RepID=A0ABS5HXF4_9GAMM|nr:MULTISPECIES: DUF1289 domain-containing protein [Shewanella]MBR9726420.1 DUF1289 domain-containing protein [Shewanella intestini]MRG35014.1 DUF1289 domain-containing protein [Shewanella sp. XMDDZSB0408]
MEQLSFFNLPSPCVGICKTDARGYCMGCFRNRDERFQWMNLSDQQKQNVVRLCLQRKRRRQYALYKAKQQQLLQQQAQQNPQFDFSDDTLQKPTDTD